MKGAKQCIPITQPQLRWLLSLRWAKGPSQPTRGWAQEVRWALRCPPPSRPQQATPVSPARDGSSSPGSGRGRLTLRFSCPCPGPSPTRSPCAFPEPGLFIVAGKYPQATAGRWDTWVGVREGHRKPNPRLSSKGSAERHPARPGPPTEQQAPTQPSFLTPLCLQPSRHQGSPDMDVLKPC